MSLRVAAHLAPRFSPDDAFLPALRAAAAVFGFRAGFSVFANLSGFFGEAAWAVGTGPAATRPASGGLPDCAAEGPGAMLPSMTSVADLDLPLTRVTGFGVPPCLPASCEAQAGAARVAAGRPAGAARGGGAGAETAAGSTFVGVGGGGVAGAAAGVMAAGVAAAGGSAGFEGAFLEGVTDGAAFASPACGFPLAAAPVFRLLAPFAFAEGAVGA